MPLPDRERSIGLSRVLAAKLVRNTNQNLKEGKLNIGFVSAVLEGPYAERIIGLVMKKDPLFQEAEDPANSVYLNDGVRRARAGMLEEIAAYSEPCKYWLTSDIELSSGK